MTSSLAFPSSSSSSSSPEASSASLPSLRQSFESQKYVAATLSILYDAEAEVFLIGQCLGAKRPFIEAVPAEQLSAWLANYCTQELREHYDRLAEAAQRQLYMEDLTPDSLAAVGSLDLGIDL